MKIACPNCGADIEFDISSGKMYCSYCGSYSDVNKLELSQFNNEKIKPEVTDSKDTPKYGALNNNQSDFSEFNCSSCGASLVTDNNTVISRCVFCGSQNLLKQRLSGRFEPKKVAPFKINKEQFISIYKNFINKKILAPNEFRNHPYIAETRGLYVPFYLYNYEITSYGRGEAYRRSDKHTYYTYFEHERKDTALIQVDGSKRLDDSIMSSLEPFNFNELVSFNPAYLAGFQAEKTDEVAEMLDLKAENRALMHTKKVIDSSVSPYKHSGGLAVSDLKKTVDPEYVLLPIWFLNTNFDNKKYSYAINAQTGKVVGEVPLSKVKFYPLMAFLTAIAITLSIAVITAMPRSSRSRRSSSSDDDGPGSILALIWGGIVVAPYFSIKHRYKNVTHVLSNPIKTWNTQIVKNKKYTSKKEYKKTFPNDDLSKITFQKYENGKFVTNINLGKMLADSNSVLNQNFTVNKEEL